MTVQPALQKGPMTTNVFVKVGMICASQGMSWTYCGMGIVAVADNDTTCLLVVLTFIFGAAVFIGPCGACGTIYRCDASVSAIPVCTSGIEVPT